MQGPGCSLYLMGFLTGTAFHSLLSRGSAIPAPTLVSHGTWAAVYCPLYLPPSPSPLRWLPGSRLYNCRCMGWLWILPMSRSNDTHFIKRKCCLLFTYAQAALVVWSPPANAREARDTGLIPGSGRSPGVGKEDPLQRSCLENSMEPGRLQSMGFLRVGHDWSNWTHSSPKEWGTHIVFGIRIIFKNPKCESESVGCSVMSNYLPSDEL